MDLLYYASGGGHGHVLRGLAVLSRLGSGTLAGPERLRPWAETLGVRYVVPPESDAGEADATARLRAMWLDAMPRPDLLLVDVFPRGVVGELRDASPEVPRWLVTRSVPAGYYRHPPVAEALRRFELVVWTEPVPDGLGTATVRPLANGCGWVPAGAEGSVGPPGLVVPPVLLAPEPLAREEARGQLGVGSGPVLLTIGTGDAQRQSDLARLTRRLGEKLGLETRFVSTELGGLPDGRGADVHASGGAAECSLTLFPLARWLPAADVVVAAGGYHAVHEIRASGVSAVFIPQARPYDDQVSRVRGEVVADSPDALEARVREALRRPRERVLDGSLGARILARLVECRMKQGVLGEEQIAALVEDQ